MFFHQSRRMRLCTGDIRVLFIRRIVVDLYFLAFYLEAWREKAGIDPIAIIDAPGYLEVIKKIGAGYIEHLPFDHGFGHTGAGRLRRGGISEF